LSYDIANPAFRGEPLWLPASRQPAAAIPSAVYPWLIDPGSLTQRIKLACGGPFRVEVIRQGWGRPQLNEMRRLGMRLSRYGLIREVRLLCNERPWVFARTVIPASSLRGRLRRLAMQGTRPLGATLFADPGMRREEPEIARIHSGHGIFVEALRHSRARPAAIWGRRSVFYLDDKPLLVSEIFLPEILKSAC
jgi:chorismate--pyruvate lyase